ncbi:precorrin-8X methylmutase [Magnetovibrio sp. PR-2]|uniref:precorrin-8X methylmutase n=1 Tax=Magnetovibrio sp. PR-2 TaxID=3120356 RepID=UPI002FCE34C9
MSSAISRSVSDTFAFDYIHEPDAISAESFARIRAEAQLDHLPGLMQAVAERVIHANASLEAGDSLRFTEGAPERVRQALEAGAPILVDSHMVRRGITRRFLPVDNEVVCCLDDEGVSPEAKSRGETRSAIAVERWADRLDGAVCVFGNAPTALFRLLEMLQLETTAKPAAILGFTVGFVGAKESKEALLDQVMNGPLSDISVIATAGRLGGSPVAAGALNAIALGGNP